MAVHTVLLVAAHTATEPQVLAAVRARAAAEPVALTLLVPASPPRGTWVWDERDARVQARIWMRRAAARLRECGVAVRTVLGDHDPMDAVRDELRRARYDEIVISTLTSRVSRWLRMDLVARVAREFAGPVMHLGSDGVPPSTLVGSRRAA